MQCQSRFLFVPVLFWFSASRAGAVPETTGAACDFGRMPRYPIRPATFGVVALTHSFIRGRVPGEQQPEETPYEPHAT